MTRPGVRAVRDALRARQDDLEQALFTQAVVVAVAPTTVTVRFPPSTTGQTWPRLNPAVGLAVGDVVVMAGQPGSWTCLGTISGARDYAAATITATNRFRGNVGGPNDGFSTHGTHFGGVASAGAATTVEGGNHLGNTATFQDSIGAVNLTYGGRVEDAQGNVRTPASDRAMKRKVEPLPDSPLAAFARVEWPSWEYLPRPADDGPWATQAPVRHVGAMAQDMLADPVLSLAVRDVDGTPGVETSDLVGIGGGALAEAHDRIVALEAKMDRLTRALEQVTGKVL